MPAEETKTAQLPNTIVTGASTAVSRNAWLWECAPNVSTPDVRVAMGTYVWHVLYGSNVTNHRVKMCDMSNNVMFIQPDHALELVVVWPKSF